MLTIMLASVPPCLGIYHVKGVAHPSLPERMRFLHPDAAKSFAQIASWVVVSDMFRSPESSLRAVREGRGAQPPGYSAHNYGLAIDIAISETMLNVGLTSKAALDAEMEKHGFYCHRRDHANGHEAWHYNFLGVGATVAGARTSDEIERRILTIYGADTGRNVNAATMQSMLARLHLYSGAIDGDVGPLTREALRAFQRTWNLDVNSGADVKTLRTLAYVSSVRLLVDDDGHPTMVHP